MASVLGAAEPDDAGTGGEVAIQIVIVGPVSVAGGVLEAVDMLSDDSLGFTQNRVADSHSLLHTGCVKNTCARVVQACCSAHV